MNRHILKIWPEPFAAVTSGIKNFEVRTADRPFAIGDYLDLREYLPDEQRFTGRSAVRQISYIVHGGEWELPQHVCVLGWALPLNK